MEPRLMAATAIAFLSSVTSAMASDGVVEINQAAALVGGVTPGDAPGFPVTISQRGSYRLTGNLNSPIATGAIVITSTMVTLDLGGFVVASTNVCTGYPTTSCTTTAGTAGISADAAAFLVTVRNGIVTAMGGDCIALNGPSSEVEFVRAFQCGGVGIGMYVGGASRVAHSFSGLNFRFGIVVNDGSTVEDNEVRANGLSGVDVDGIRLPTLVARNRVFDNAGYGVNAVGAVVRPVLRQNVFSSNTFVPWDFATSAGDNACNASFC